VGAAVGRVLEEGAAGIEDYGVESQEGLLPLKTTGIHRDGQDEQDTSKAKNDDSLSIPASLALYLRETCPPPSAPGMPPEFD
jgi:hypothetical protein